MFAAVGGIVDRVYDQVVSKRRPRKQLLFIVGNGIRQVSNILNEDQVRKEAAKRKYIVGTNEFEDFRWRLFEYARYYTANHLPSYAHCCIHRMLRDGACSHVITTNYDMFFDSVWRKYPSMQVSTNPIATKGEYLWDGYYAYKSSKPNAKSYWKIHGSLSHGVFRSSLPGHHPHMLVPLPRIAIPTNRPEIAAHYGVGTTSPFLGYEATVNPGTAFPAHRNLESTFRPFIDWSYDNDRSRYSREINAVTEILRNPGALEAIILIGFRGYYNHANPKDPWNEELVPVLEDLVKAGFDDIFMAVHKMQFATISAPTSTFLKDRHSCGKAAHFSDAGAMMRDLLSRYSKRFPYNLVDAEHAKWANYYYLSGNEASHA